jgi:hypothetical protein
MVADMSHAFPASSRGDCGYMRSNTAECGELSTTDQGLESQVADGQRVSELARTHYESGGQEFESLRARQKLFE